MPSPDPIQLLKQQVARAVTDRLDGWSQEYAADFLGTDQPRMSDLRRSRLARFSLARLIRFVDKLGGEVMLRVTWTERRRLVAYRRPPR
jgi:predicted XRE-type DNA-binding protein